MFTNIILLVCSTILDRLQQSAQTNVEDTLIDSVAYASPTKLLHINSSKGNDTIKR